MKLDEILNKPLPYKITHDYDEEFRAEFKAGNRIIVFNAENDETMFGDADEGNWNIHFGQKRNDSDELDYDLTKSGNEFEVFATLKVLIKKFLDKYDPKYVSFSADDKARGKAYTRLFNRNLPLGWKMNRQELGGGLIFFELMKESLNEALSFVLSKA